MIQLPAKPVFSQCVMVLVFGGLFVTISILQTIMMFLLYDMSIFSKVVYILLFLINLSFALFFIIITALFLEQYSDIFFTYILVAIFFGVAIIYLICCSVISSYNTLDCENITQYVKEDKIVKTFEMRVYNRKIEVLIAILNCIFLSTLIGVLAMYIIAEWFMLLIVIAIELFLLYATYNSFSIEGSLSNSLIYLILIAFVLSIASMIVYFVIIT